MIEKHCYRRRESSAQATVELQSGNVLTGRSSMSTVRGILRSRRCLSFIVLFCMTGTVVTRAENSVNSPNEAYLDALQGTWTMEGTLRGNTVRYRADAQRVLQGKFVELHMVDTGPPPQYEADVFIGFDAR